MTPEQLKTARNKLGWSQLLTARILQTPLRTYQGWENGEARIPGMLIVTMGLLMERDERTFKQVIADAVTRIEQFYPNGIQSAPVIDDLTEEEP